MQLWFYLSHYPVHHDEIKFWGFFNLEEPYESQFYFPNQNIHDYFLENIWNKQDGKTHYLREEIQTKLEQYAAVEKFLIQEIFIHKKFLIRPRKDDVCTYCSVKNICPKHEIA